MKRTAVSFILIGCLLPMVAEARTLYVDCASGLDELEGSSPAAAWRTLGKVSATEFFPGDSILLARGTRCAGPPPAACRGSATPCALHAVDVRRMLTVVRELKKGIPD